MNGWRSGRVLLLLVGFGFAVHLQAGELETIDDRKFTGTVIAADNAFVVTSGSAAPQRVTLSRVRRVIFSNRAEPAPTDSASVEWHGQSVGALGIKGSFTQSNEVIHVTATGSQKRFSDGRFCAWQPLGEQGEIVAFVPAPDTLAKEGQRYRVAGIELLASLDGSGPRVSLVTEHGRNVIVQSRTSAGKERSKHIAIKGKGVWLRLVRNKLEIIPSLSLDGEAWRRLDTEIIALPDSAFATLSVCGAKSDLAINVPFSNVRVTRRSTAVAPAKPVLLTRSGSRLNGDYLGADGSVVRWAALGREWNVSLVNVSRLVFQPEATALLRRLAPDRVGALFANGEFVDGELLRSDRTRVTISSVLFGIRSFPVNDELVAVCVRGSSATVPPLQITHHDGSVLKVQELSIQPASLILREAGLGEITLPLDTIQELTR